MKKLLLGSAFFVLLVSTGKSQVDSDFDKKFRLGLRVTPQTSWFSSSLTNNVPAGARLGFGFGLNLEYRLSEVVALLTGIGGDFEAAKYNFRSDYVGNYVAAYFKDNANEFIELKNGSADNFKKSGVTAYMLKNRTVNTTFVTLPAILKLSTRVYDNKMKYFGLFGAEIGIRVKCSARDNFYAMRRYVSDTSYVDYNLAADLKEQTSNLGKDASLIPMRLGFHTGFGIEYNLGGSTFFLASLSYFRSFTNFSRKESRYLFYNWQEFSGTSRGGSINFKAIEQRFLLNALRLNLGFMF